MGCCLKFYELLVQFIVQHQDGSCVIATVTVVWGRPDCYQLTVEHLFVALHNKLVSTHNFCDIVIVIEGVNDISSE